MKRSKALAFSMLVAFAAPAAADPDPRANKDLEGARIADELSTFAERTRSSRKRIAVDADFDWSGVQEIFIAPVRFNLDPEFFAERYDLDSRDIIDATVGENDQEFLAKRLMRRLDAKLDDLAPLVDAPAPGAVTVEPVITFVSRSRPGVDQLGRRPGLDINSVSAGEAAVRFNLRDGDGRLVGSVYFRDDSSFLDNQPRPTEWSDATFALGLSASVLKKALKKEGVGERSGA